MTASRARLVQLVTRIARDTGADPLDVLAQFALKLADNPSAQRDIDAEFADYLSGVAYREFVTA